MAHIFIKRRRDPISLEDERAKKVKNRWLGSGGAVKAEPNEVIDLGEWTGEYSQISFIEIEGEKRRDEWTMEKTRDYTDAELSKFNIEMQKYMTVKHDGGIDGKQTYDDYDVDAFFLDKKAISFKEHLGVKTRSVIIVDGKIPFETWSNKIDQWNTWRARKVFGKRKRDEDLEAMLNSIDMSVDFPS